MNRLIAATFAVAFLAAGCSSDDATDTSDGDADVTDEAAADDSFPTILAVDATHDAGTDLWTFAVTVSSPYDTRERYADGWRVIGPDQTVYGVHTLAHDHASEQPFTRRQTGVAIPTDVDEVTIEGRDLVNGFGGPSLTIDLERNS